MTRTGEMGKAGSGDPGGPVQLRGSVPGGHTSHGAGSCRPLRSKAVGPPRGSQLCGRSSHLTATLL